MAFLLYVHVYSCFLMLLAQFKTLVTPEDIYVTFLQNVYNHMLRLLVCSGPDSWLFAAFPAIVV